jgi:hypothetical protein
MEIKFSDQLKSETENKKTFILIQVLIDTDNASNYVQGRTKIVKMMSIMFR